MTNIPPSNNAPSNGDDDFVATPGPIDPGPIEPVDELLSALVDGELGRDDLIDLEEQAVDGDWTIDEGSAPFDNIRTSVGSLLDEPAPAGLRSGHIAAALDAMDEPEVVSLAAARVDRRTSAEQVARSQKLNQRLRQLSAVAAGFVVVAGIGLVAISLNQGGDDTASGAAESSALEDEAFMRESASDDGAGDGAASDEAATTTTAAESASAAEVAPADDAMEEGDDAMSEDDAMEEEAEPRSRRFDERLANAVEVSPELDLTAVDVQLLSADVGVDQGDVLEGALTDGDVPICFDVAAEVGIDPAMITQGIIIEQSGVTYELIVLETEELRVFELPDCIRID